MQRVFHFRTDTISVLINVLATDHSDQSRVLLRLLKIILKCRNPEDILSKLSPNTDTPQPTTNTTSYAQTDEIKPEETIENVETVARSHGSSRKGGKASRTVQSVCARLCPPDADSVSLAVNVLASFAPVN